MNENQFNFMNVIYKNLLLDLPLKFREAACRELSWSVPTFYRRMRKTKKGMGTTGGFSRAEWQSIEQVGLTMIANLGQDFKTEMAKYKRLLDNNN